MPPIFLHEKGDKEFIVDGQQRLNTLWKFKDDNLDLSEKFSKDIINDDKNKQRNNGKGAYKYTELHKDWQDKFDSYPITVIHLRDYDDEEIRDLFRRLQRGKPLNPSEILNAYRGNIVLTMRKLASHKFFSSIVPVKPVRYKHFYLVAQIIFLESEGIKDISPKYIKDFFEKNESLDQSSKVYTRVNKILNYLAATFQTKTPEIRKPGWIITLYLFTAHLIENYAVDNQKDNLKEFFIDFYQKIVNSSASGDKELIDFNLAISKGTTSQSNLKSRYGVFLKKILDKYHPARLDENRLFNDDQKIAIFRRDEERCQVCRRNLTYR